MTHLFTLPIPNTTSGSFTCTTPFPRVYLLTFTSPPDNRLTTAFLQTFNLALDILEHRHPRGVLITTSSIQKFYSNGLDLDHVHATPGFFPNTLHPLLARLLTYPMPTVALLNGHTFAGGFILAMHHDYRFQNPSRGFLSLNEVLFGYLMEQPLLAAIRDKVAPATFRSLILEGHRFAAGQAREEGLVDGVGGLEEVLEFVGKRELVKKGETGVYGRMKENMYRRTLDSLLNHDDEVRGTKAINWERDGRTQEAKKRLEAWEAGIGKAKL